MTKCEEINTKVSKQQGTANYKLGGWWEIKRREWKNIKLGEWWAYATKRIVRLSNWEGHRFIEQRVFWDYQTWRVVCLCYKEDCETIKLRRWWDIQAGRVAVMQWELKAEEGAEPRWFQNFVRLLLHDAAIFLTVFRMYHIFSMESNSRRTIEPSAS